MIILIMTILKRTSESYILHHLLCLTLMISLIYNSSVCVKLLIQRALHCFLKLFRRKMKISKTFPVSRNQQLRAYRHCAIITNVHTVCLKLKTDCHITAYHTVPFTAHECSNWDSVSRNIQNQTIQSNYSHHHHHHFT